MAHCSRCGRTSKLTGRRFICKHCPLKIGEASPGSVRSQGLLSGHSIVRWGSRVSQNHPRSRRQSSPVILLRRTCLDRRSALTAEGRSRSLTKWITIFALLLIAPALAQHAGHNLYHASYQSWYNSELKPKGCCNDRDCADIAENEERMSGSTIEVYVRGVGVAKSSASWCPVMPHHYLSKGNVPNAAVSHICVTDHYGGKTPCEQFICYQPRPLT